LPPLTVAFYFKVVGNNELRQHCIPAIAPGNQADWGKVPKGNVVREEVQASGGGGLNGLLPEFFRVASPFSQHRGRRKKSSWQKFTFGTKL